MLATLYIVNGEINDVIAAGGCIQSITAKTNFGIVVDFPKRIAPSSGRTDIQPSFPTRYIILRVRVISGAPDDWTLRLYDRVGRPLISYSAASVGGATEFSTDRLPVSQLSMLVESSLDRDVIETLYYVAMPTNIESHYYSIKGQKPDWRVLHRPDEMGYRVSRGESVGMLVGSYGNNVSGHYIWTCSGVVVSTAPTILFATADHCGAPDDFKDLAWSNSIRQRMRVDLSWDGDTVSREYAVDGGPVLRDMTSDIAVIPLKAGDYPVHPKPSKLKDLSSQSRQSVFIIHHPASEQKSISANCTIKSVTTQAGIIGLTHDCDTVEGSSGAPIFDESGDIVGLHVGGFEADPSGNCTWQNKGVASQMLKQLLMPKN